MGCDCVSLVVSFVAVFMLCGVAAAPVFVTEFKLTPAEPGTDFTSDVLTFLNAIGWHLSLANITVSALG